MSVAPVLLAFAAATLGAAGVGLLVAPIAGRSRPRAPRLPVLLGFAGARVARHGATAPRDLAARVTAAGRPGGLGAREVMGAKLAAGAAGGAVGTVIGAAAPGRLGPVVAVACPLTAFFGPDLWLVRLAAARARRVRRELPAMLDLLRVNVEAGASLAAALGAVGARSDGPLAREWRVAAAQVELGVPLQRALRDLAVRLPLPELHTFVSALERARRHGASPAEALAAQAHEARFALRRRIQEEAARAGPKIQLVVALLLVPSVLLLVAAALAAALLQPGAQVMAI